MSPSEGGDTEWALGEQHDLLSTKVTRHGTFNLWPVSNLSHLSVPTLSKVMPKTSKNYTNQCPAAGHYGREKFMDARFEGVGVLELNKT